MTSTKSKTLVINFILIFFSAILSSKTKKSVCVNALPQSNICFYFVSVVHDSLKNEFKKNIFSFALALVGFVYDHKCFDTNTINQIIAQWRICFMFFFIENSNCISAASNSETQRIFIA